MLSTVPWLFSTLVATHPFSNLCSLRLRVSKEESIGLNLCVLSNLQRLAALELHLPRSGDALVVPGSDCFPCLTKLVLICASPHVDSISSFPNFLAPLPRLETLGIPTTITTIPDGTVLTMFPNLHCLITLDYGDVKDILEAANKLHDLKPGLWIRNFRGTFWEDHCHSDWWLQELERQHHLRPACKTWSINAAGKGPDPPFQSSGQFGVLDMVRCGWNPRNRYHNWFTTRDELLLKICCVPGRSIGALMNAVCRRALIEAVVDILPFWADVPIQQLIETEPIHPVLAAVALGCSPFMEFLLQRSAEWDWFAPVEAVPGHWLYRVPLIVACLAVLCPRDTFRRPKYSKHEYNFEVDVAEFFSVLSDETLTRLQVLLNAPDPHLGSLLHFLASHLKYADLKFILQRIPNLQVETPNSAGLKPVHFSLELGCAEFPTLLNVSAGEYLDSFAERPGERVAVLQQLLWDVSSVPREFSWSLLRELTKRGESLADWVRTRHPCLSKAAFEALFSRSRLSRDSRCEMAQQIVLHRFCDRSGQDLRQSFLDVCYCRWLSTQSFVEFVFSHWAREDFEKVPHIFKWLKCQLRLQREVSLQTLSAASLAGDMQVIEFLWERLKESEPEDHSAEVLILVLRAVMGPKMLALFVRCRRAQRKLFPLLLDRIESFDPFEAPELVAIAARGIALGTDLRLIDKVLAPLPDYGYEADRWLSLGRSKCAWQAALEGGKRLQSAYVEAACDTLIARKICSQHAKICTGFSYTVHPYALSKYLSQHPSHLCATSHRAVISHFHPYA